MAITLLENRTTNGTGDIVELGNNPKNTRINTTYVSAGTFDGAKVIIEISADGVTFVALSETSGTDLEITSQRTDVSPATAPYIRAKLLDAGATTNVSVWIT